MDFAGLVAFIVCILIILIVGGIATAANPRRRR